MLHVFLWVLTRISRRQGGTSKLYTQRVEKLNGLWFRIIRLCLVLCHHRAAAWHWGKTDHLAESPGRLRKCPGRGRWGVSVCNRIPPPLPLHSAPHLKALVMHSSSPATSRVIQFPRQRDRVKCHLHLRVPCKMGCKSLSASTLYCFV